MKLRIPVLLVGIATIALAPMALAQPPHDPHRDPPPREEHKEPLQEQRDQHGQPPRDEHAQPGHDDHGQPPRDEHAQPGHDEGYRDHRVLVPRDTQRENMIRDHFKQQQEAYRVTRKAQRKDPKVWVANRPQRATERRTVIVKTWGAVVVRPSAHAELATHEERMARLDRILDRAGQGRHRDGHARASHHRSRERARRHGHGPDPSNGRCTVRTLVICLTAALFVIACDKKDEKAPTPGATTSTPAAKAKTSAPTTGSTAAAATTSAPAAAGGPVLSGLGADGGLTTEALSTVPTEEDYEAKAESEITAANATQELQKLDTDVGGK